MDGRTDVRTDIFPTSNIIRSTFESRPKKQIIMYVCMHKMNIKINYNDTSKCVVQQMQS